MSLSSAKIILAGSGNTSNAVGAYFEKLVVLAASAANGTVVPAGLYVMYPTANVTVTAYDGSANTTWLANNTGGLVLSDGINVRILASAGNINVTFLQINEGIAAPQTFNT